MKTDTMRIIIFTTWPSPSAIEKGGKGKGVNLPLGPYGVLLAVLTDGLGAPELPPHDGVGDGEGEEGDDVGDGEEEVVVDGVERGVRPPVRVVVPDACHRLHPPHV